VQGVARVAGIAFLAVGVAGFVPGLTTNLYDGLEFSGSDGTSELLGTFDVSVLHNVVHGLFGLAGLALAATPRGARTFLLGGGALYVTLFALGLAGGVEWLPADRADDWLHLALGAGMIGAGVAASRTSAGRSHAAS
jgi:hypothetical protein